MCLFLMESFAMVVTKRSARDSSRHSSRLLSIPLRAYRTHNRNRSLSFTNSDQLVNVNKGSKSDRSHVVL